MTPVAAAGGSRDAWLQPGVERVPDASGTYPYESRIATTGSPTRTMPPLRMSARSPPRCARPRSVPGGASRCRCEHGSARRRPTHSTGPIRKRRPTSAFNAIPRVTTFRRASSHVTSTPSACERLERLRLDQGQLVAAAASRETARAIRVAVASQAASRDRLRFGHLHERRFRRRRDQQSRDDALTNRLPVRRSLIETELERRHRDALRKRATPASSPAGSSTGPEGEPNMRTASRSPPTPSTAAIQ